MNPIIDDLHSRKSVRAYEDKPIPPEIKKRNFAGGYGRAYSRQPAVVYHFGYHRPEYQRPLAITCDNQPFIAKAQMVLIFCADLQKWYDAFDDCGCQPRLPGKGDMLIATDDALIAAQNAVTAAWSLGIGSCYIGDIMEQVEEHRKLLNLPRYVFPAAMLVFGYPTQQQMDRTKPLRCDPQLMVHENTYRQKWTVRS